MTTLVIVMAWKHSVYSQLSRDMWLNICEVFWGTGIRK